MKGVWFVDGGQQESGCGGEGDLGQEEGKEWGGEVNPGSHTPLSGKTAPPAAWEDRMLWQFLWQLSKVIYPLHGLGKGGLRIQPRVKIKGENKRLPSCYYTMHSAAAEHMVRCREASGQGPSTRTSLKNRNRC